MAEYQAGKGTTALGIIGTALGGLATAAGGGLLANAAGSQTSGDYITKEVFEVSMELNKAETKNALLEAKLNTEHEIAALKDYQAGVNAAQAVTNSLATSQMAVMQNNINQLMSLTKVVIPNSSSAPGWGNVVVVPQPPVVPDVSVSTPTPTTSTTSAG